ncbi:MULTISPECIES: anthranilate synthase component I family protein [Mycobacterium]|uniref:anthranilate synthase component I family protein n=1 Tax=Mycobacterium TaxID=1763 RepID=UPI00200E6950|nr:MULTISPECIES: anthranilate synthase component I family protein [Mycobacterium]UQB93095.1 anthranilate synthase component I family protein [Mycobacterium intracellulare]WSE46188.1 anthranilate synthase component I family protein [Mycobacterium sp. 3-98]
MAGGIARFDDLTTGTSIVFPEHDAELLATTADQVPDVLAQLTEATQRGWWAFGFLAYEAAAGLNPVLAAAISTGNSRQPADVPLAWFGLTRHPVLGQPPAGVSIGTGTNVSASTHWSLDWSVDEYLLAFNRVKEAIAAGETYQCNLSTTISGHVRSSPHSFYKRLLLAQRCPYGAYLNCGDFAVVSASPELFFEWVGDQVLTRPMKGTRPRGQTPEEDRNYAAELVSDPKERAENIIVVDLMRNDLGTIAEAVTVPKLLVTQRYQTVWQMTSDVVATVPADLELVDLFRALFPSGSVTGAPKASTMRLIRELEGRPRGLYCGAIGIVAPLNAPFRARFSVAIRTAHLHRSGCFSYGVGSGITWSSRVDAEWAELMMKAAILSYPPSNIGLNTAPAISPTERATASGP